jgi:tRNA U34 5-methylaminomethyl-2-thiouridine-forming methyltransferase MnmC
MLYNSSMSSLSPWVSQVTQDGSYTFFSTEFGETFHSVQGARTEAFQKFAQATRLAQKAQAPSEYLSIRLLDVCYGLGYNTAAALETIWSVNSKCAIELYGLELDPTVPTGALTPDLLGCWSPPVQSVLQDLGQVHHHRQDRLRAKLLLGDARQTVKTLIQTGFKADAIFFDPFSPQHCPQLWSVEFFQAIAECLAPDGILSTYSRSAAVRTALQLAGLYIGTIATSNKPLHQEWSQGTVAAWHPENLSPLSLLEQEHLNTRASIPFRDPNLTDSRDVILARHQQEQQETALESTSSWRRRWGIH